MIDVGLVTLLRQHAGVAKRIGPSTETVKVSEDLPRVVYTLISAPRLYTDDGNSGLIQARYQLDIFADKVTEARAVADAIRVGLDGYRGTQDATSILRIHFPDDGFASASRAAGQSASVARFTSEMRVDYRESTS